MSGHWVWRRQRNRSHGYWENIKTGERVGPIPLDENGRALFVPSTDRPASVGEVAAWLMSPAGDDATGIGPNLRRQVAGAILRRFH